MTEYIYDGQMLDRFSWVLFRFWFIFTLLVMLHLQPLFMSLTPVTNPIFMVMAERKNAWKSASGLQAPVNHLYPMCRECSIRLGWNAVPKFNPKFSNWAFTYCRISSAHVVLIVTICNVWKLSITPYKILFYISSRLHGLFMMQWMQ